MDGFCAGIGTGTATLKAKLLQQLIYMRETVLNVIFLDLFKAYYALDREHCQDTLTGYGVGPRKIRILRTYWDRPQMAEKVGGHYGPAFQSHRGVTQGDPLPPMIFNVAVDTFIKHWVKVAGGPQEGDGQEGLGTSIQALSVFFYADDRLIASPMSSHLQGAFDALTT